MGNNSTLQNSSEMSQIVLYQPEEDVVLEVKLDKNTIWLSQQQIADLFGVQKSAISKHMKNIFGTGELVREQEGVSKLICPLFLFIINEKKIKKAPTFSSWGFAVP